MKNNFLKEMSFRGYLNQCTDLDKLDEICNKKTITAYIGFDCTASSLHVGSLLQIMILKLMQKYDINDFFFLDQAVKILANGAKSPFQGCFLHVDKRHFNSRLSEHMRNSVAHCPGPDDSNVLHGEKGWKVIFWLCLQATFLQSSFWPWPSSRSLFWQRLFSQVLFWRQLSLQALSLPLPWAPFRR